MSKFAKDADAFAIELAQYLNAADVSTGVAVAALTTVLLTALRGMGTHNAPATALELLDALPRFIDDLAIVGYLTSPSNE